MLQRIHAVLQNSFFSAMILSVVLILTLLIAIFGVLYLPISIGEQPQTLYVDEMYYFPSLNLPGYEYLEIEYPNGGFIIPAYNHIGSLKGIAVIGNGTYTLTPPDSSFRQQGVVTNFYRPIQEEQLALLLLEAEFIEITNRNQVISTNEQIQIQAESTEFFDQMRSDAQALFEKESDIYISIHLFGYKRVYTADSDTLIGLLVTNADEHFVYYENQTISMHDYYTHKDLFRTEHPSVTHDYPPKNLLIYASITLSLLLIASIIVVWLLTIDLDVKKQILKLVEQIEYPHWLVWLTVLLYFLSQLLLAPYSNSDHWTIVITIALYTLLLFAFCKNHAERQYIGLNFYHWGHAIISALILGFFFQMLGSFQIPSQFNIGSWGDFLKAFAGAFFFHALISEIIFRGLIQNYIERLSNTFVAICATAGVVALTNCFVNLYIHEMALIEVMIQSFLIAPFGSVVFSMLYARTRNIFASSLLATLLIILPQILRF